MIAEHKISIVGYNDFRKGPRILIVRRHVGFGEFLTIDIHVSVRDADAITRYADNALDKALACISGVAESNNIAAFNALKSVNQLVDKDPLLVFQARLHAAALNFYRLIQKQAGKE